ncbi:hypothetical protein JQT66_05825 [Sulfitobacter mediterraneus]|uniref:Uncharacterized protein n=1 Tax=Sulfitobacter mediterraneus TaxID=83219 RepID=A0A061SP55_9RHOB|nr:hypothetical protein [Sulfitobacter mediterraneus]KAJ03506.1 hypothetical protein PM02_09190 [Sulfitobacter mediterraneus]MBM1309677.1 hypothetical protein [Sulfitobacter mediterraneus]MBM1313562.1 hypothetical protein [Sulfitobacter mediterraneus]MBM1321946.1 hypothetical protein [Sulfitobacter mediterraneus]MBM1325833.1 hypothetical protein [Sulfitobacter mediterraneus]
MTDLDRDLLAAHAAGDTSALVALYAQAAEAANNTDQAAFYLTHAHVFAMEIGHPDTPALRQRLIDMGRESPLPAPNPPLR